MDKIKRRRRRAVGSAIVRHRAAVRSTLRSAIVGHGSAAGILIAAPHHIERVAFGSTVRILDADYGDPAIARVADQRLAATAIDALEADHKFLLEGGVFTQDVIDVWIDYKRAEIDEVRLRPHPWEFHLYFDM